MATKMVPMIALATSTSSFPREPPPIFFKLYPWASPPLPIPWSVNCATATNLKYDQNKSSHGSASHLHSSGGPAPLLKNGLYDGTISYTDYDGTTTEKWNVTYHDNGHKEFKISDGGTFNTANGRV